MKKEHILLPKNNSRFVKIECAECNSVDVIFTHSSTLVNCSFCGNLLVTPTGSIAQINGKLLEAVDAENDKPIPKIKQRKTSEKIHKDLLLDTMMIHDYLSGIDISKNLQLRSGRNDLKIILLDRIIRETINMSRDRYGKNFQYDEIIQKISQLGHTRIEKIDHASKSSLRARELFESEKYKNDLGVPLSETDCLLLVWYLENDVDLITRDRLMIDASTQEGRTIKPL